MRNSSGEVLVLLLWCDSFSRSSFGALPRLATIQDGNRILSAYPIDPAKPCMGFGENCVWIITEVDRSVTTFLVPEEY